MDREEAEQRAEIARRELRGRLLAQYSSINAVAKAMKVPYKSAYRYLTTETDQRNVPFWFLLQGLSLVDVTLEAFEGEVDAQFRRSRK